MVYDKITNKELKAMYRDDGITPNYTYEDYVIERNEKGETIAEYYVNLTIHKTADEVYEESLLPPIQEPTEIELLQQDLAEQLEYTVDLDFRITNIEIMGGM